MEAAGYQDAAAAAVRWPSRDPGRRAGVGVDGDGLRWFATSVPSPVLVVGTEGRGVGPPPEDAAWVAAGDGAAVDAGFDPSRQPAAPGSAARGRRRRRAVRPDRDALVIGSFLNEAAALCGRPFLAWRRPEWLALEDKLVADAIWDRQRCPEGTERGRVAGRRRPMSWPPWPAGSTGGVAPSGPPTPPRDGTAVPSWCGGSAASDDVGAGAGGAAPARSRPLRVMPFLEGVPCSIHGIVYPGHVSALRPVEQISFRRPGQPRFWYAGCATFYDPPAAVREAMRDAARRVGAHLRETVGYLGAFTIDGIVDEQDGFLPTELNPRSGAGLHTMLRPLPEIPFQLLLDALVGGLAPRLRPRRSGGARRRVGRCRARRRHLAPDHGAPAGCRGPARRRGRRRLGVGRGRAAGRWLRDRW